MDCPHTDDYLDVYHYYDLVDGKCTGRKACKHCRFGYSDRRGCVVCGKKCKNNKNYWYVKFGGEEDNFWFLTCSLECSTAGEDKMVESFEKIQGKKRCRNCGVFAEKMLKCGNCRKAYYCDVDCQKANWAEHKQVCSLAK